MGEFFFLTFAIALGFFLSDMAGYTVKFMIYKIADRKLRKAQEEMLNSLALILPQQSQVRVPRGAFDAEPDPTKYN